MSRLGDPSETGVIICHRGNALEAMEDGGSVQVENPIIGWTPSDENLWTEKVKALDLMDTKHIEEVEEEHEEIKSAKGNKTFADIAGAEMEIHEEINADPDRKVAGGHLEGGEGEIPEELTDKEVKLNVNLKSDIPEELPGHDDEGKEGKEVH
eukprot:214318-Amorphochlora_amoeboformis.AAC.1